jgi:DNA polymerase III epsilon subunit-like protein
MNFVAIDFETANSSPASACAIGIVCVDDGEITKQEYHLIRPPELYFSPYNIAVHGIRQKDVINQPSFIELWPSIRQYFDQTTIIAHNAGFDVNVLRNCLDFYKIPYPNFNYGCTLTMSRKHWPNHENYKLSTIAATIDHDFHHHHAGEDALACASIALQIFKTYNANSLEELSGILGFSVKYLSKDNPAVIPSNCVPNIPKSEVDKALNTLQGIITGIAIDSVINIHEIKELEYWFKLNQHFLNRPPFSDIVRLLEEAFADHVFTIEEKADIIWVCNNYSSKSIYHDLITYDIQILHGLLHGILGDNTITLKEIQQLNEWLTVNDHLTGVYPYDELCSLLTVVLKDGHLSEQEQHLLKVFFSDFVDIRASHNLNDNELQELRKSINISGICALCPQIIIPDRVFCFTGVSSRSKRSDIKVLVESQGGIFKNTVVKDTSYLVVGNEGNPCWAFSCYGRKVEQAVKLRKAGSNILIVHENDFWNEVG